MWSDKEKDLYENFPLTYFESPLNDIGIADKAISVAMFQKA